MNMIATGGLEIVCTSLSCHPCLQKVLLNTGVNTEDQQVRELFDALTTCSKLQSMLIYRSRRRDFGGGLPMKELCSMPSLETLVTDLKLDINTAQVLFRNLRANKTLKRLRMGVQMGSLDDDIPAMEAEQTLLETNATTQVLIDMMQDNDGLETLEIEGIPKSTRETLEFYLLLNFLGRKQLRRQSTAKLLDFIIANHHNAKLVFFFLSQHPNLIQNAISNCDN